MERLLWSLAVIFLAASHVVMWARLTYWRNDSHGWREMLDHERKEHYATLTQHMNANRVVGDANSRLLQFYKSVKSALEASEKEKA